MQRTLRQCAGAVLLCAMFSIAPKPAQADKLETDAIEAAVGIAAAGAAIAVAIVLIVTHKPSITGCATQGPDGLSLRNQGDSTVYVLHGDIASIAPNTRVRVSGRHHKGSSKPAVFDVAKVKKTFGSCSGSS